MLLLDTVQLAVLVIFHLPHKKDRPLKALPWPKMKEHEITTILFDSTYLPCNMTLMDS